MIFLGGSQTSLWDKIFLGPLIGLVVSLTRYGGDVSVSAINHVQLTCVLFHYFLLKFPIQSNQCLSFIKSNALDVDSYSSV